jgi:uncharacterized membrane protein YhaH (DUF805 family)
MRGSTGSSSSASAADVAKGGAWNALVASTGHNLRRLADMSGRETQIQFWPFAGLVYGLATLVSMMLMVIPLTDVFVRVVQQVGEAANRGGNAQPEFVKSPEMLAPDFSSLFWPMVLINLVTVLLLAAAVARRLHDRNRTALWGLLPLPSMILGPVLMPAKMPIFAAQAAPDPLVQLVMLNNMVSYALLITLIVLTIGVGTSGPNRFGPEIVAAD